MSTATVSTTTFILTKYSRAYPRNDPVSNESETKWQYYTNPVIRLQLDMKKSSTGELESYRLRILWALDSGIDSMDLDQREVVFEDFDLLAFSSPSLQTQEQSLTANGLPIKALYRDSVVGIRYMHPRVILPEATPTYRRIQMNFLDTAAASHFIGAIRNVCPCMTSPPLAATRAMTLASENTSSHTKQLVPNRTLRLATTIQPSNMVRNLEQPSDSINMPPPTSNLSRAPDSSPTDISLSVEPAYSHLNPSSGETAQYAPPEQLQRSQLTSATHPNTSNAGFTAASSSLSNICISPALDTSQFNRTPTPGLGLSSSPTSNNTMTTQLPLPQPVPTEIAHSVPAEASPRNPQAPLLSALRDSSTLNELSTEDLEIVVAHVIQEDGFVKLLEVLDSMWKLKTVLMT